MHRIARLLALTLVVSLMLVRTPSTCQAEPLVSEAAFAALDRNGKPYPPFYQYYIAPHAIIENGKVWCAYQDGEGRPLVMAYDLTAKTWEGPRRASDFGLGSDTHGNPSICIDTQGHLHIFFGCHGRAMRHVRSQRPYDITAWEPMDSPTPRATYPQTMRMADGSMYLFYRAGGHMEPWSMRVSGDDGATWSDAERIVEMRLDPPDPKAAAYCLFEPGVENKTVHCFFVHKDDNPTRVDPHPWRPLKYPGLHEAVYRYNIYYLQRDKEGVWRAGDGTKLPLPLSKREADRLAMVHDSGHEFAAPVRLVIDDTNQPYLRYTIGVNDWKSGRVIVPRKHYAATLEDGKWNIVTEMPEMWPSQVRRLLETPGSRVHGERLPGHWSISQHRGVTENQRASFVMLSHLEDGPAVREGGPAWPPEK